MPSNWKLVTHLTVKGPQAIWAIWASWTIFPLKGDGESYVLEGLDPYEQTWFESPRKSHRGFLAFDSWVIHRTQWLPEGRITNGSR